MTAGGAFASCTWYPITTMANDPMFGCQNVGMPSGICVQTDQEDSGCPGEFDATCPSPNATVWWRATDLPNDAVELVHDQGSCTGPAGFTICAYDEAAPMDQWDPPQCGCVCPMGGG